MDGHFVPNLTIGPAVVKALRPHSALPFDVHLMISPVDPYIPAFAEAGADIITVHPEAGPASAPHGAADQVARQEGRRLAQPGDAAERARRPARRDRSGPGDDGQSRASAARTSSPAQLDKIAALRQRIDALTAGNGRAIDLEVDGGINAETARQAIGAGADVLVAGTASFAGGSRRLCRQHPAIAAGGRVSAMAESAAGPKHRRAREPIAPGLRAALRLPASMLWGQAWYDLRKPLFASRLYRLLQPTRVGSGPAPVPAADSWPGDAARGAAIGQGIFALGGQTIRDPAPLWAPVGASPSWLEELHGFEWLRDLRAASGDAGRRAGRELVGRWIENCRDWDALAWRPDLIGRRLMAWLSHYEFLAVGGDAHLPRPLHAERGAAGQPSLARAARRGSAAAGCSSPSPD